MSIPEASVDDASAAALTKKKRKKGSIPEASVDDATAAALAEKKALFDDILVRADKRKEEQKKKAKEKRASEKATEKASSSREGPSGYYMPHPRHT